MDLAYDHVQEAVIEAGDNKNQPTTPGTSTTGTNNTDLNAEFSEAYKAISNSPWGMKFGGWLGEVRKQGESYYEAARGANVAETAQRGFTGLREGLGKRVRGLSLSGGDNQVKGKEKEKENVGEDGVEKGGSAADAAAAAAREKSFLETLKKNAAKRIEEIEKAEAMADEYLLKWGSTIGNFLKDAVTIAPPEGAEFADDIVGGTGRGDVLFDQGAAAVGGAGEEGKRQIYTTRLDAQLHLLHTSHDLFLADPIVPSYKTTWANTFSADTHTEQISSDLNTYPELRATMEKLVPGEVSYKDFFQRYYFLRAELDAEEVKRKELLRGAALEEEEVGWDSGDEEEEEVKAKKENIPEKEKTQEQEKEVVKATTGPRQQASTETLVQAQTPTKPPRTSADASSAADSDTSYDIVSGAASVSGGAGEKGSPQAKGVKKPVDDESDEDWE